MNHIRKRDRLAWWLLVATCFFVMSHSISSLGEDTIINNLTVKEIRYEG